MAYGMIDDKKQTFVWLTDKRMDCPTCQAQINQPGMVSKCVACPLEGKYHNYRIGTEIHGAYLCPNHLPYAEPGALSGDITSGV